MKLICNIIFFALAISIHNAWCAPSYDSRIETEIQAWLQKPTPLVSEKKHAYAEFIRTFRSKFPGTINFCESKSIFVVRYLELEQGQAIDQSISRELTRNQELKKESLANIAEFCGRFIDKCPSIEEFELLKFANYEANTIKASIARSLPPQCKNDSQCEHNMEALHFTVGPSISSVDNHSQFENSSFGNRITILLRAYRSLINNSNKCEAAQSLAKLSDRDLLASQVVNMTGDAAAITGAAFTDGI